MAQLHHGQRLGGFDCAGAAGRALGGVNRASLAQSQVAPEPLTRGGRAHAVRLGGGTGTQSMYVDVLNHFDSTRQRKSGILMDVRLVEFSEGAGGVVIPSLSNSTQMNAYNLLGLHR